MSVQQDIAAGERFEFGRNWRRFLESVDEDRVLASEKAITEMLGDIRGKTFLDIGCGSGLSSLAAHRLGAVVHSFDYDPQSVACTQELQRRFHASWPVETGSALDTSYLGSLGTFDIVYSWGVLHQTGDMWRAIGNTITLSKRDGLVFISIYNDQGRLSDFWRVLKRAYNKSAIARAVLLCTYVPGITILRGTYRFIRGKGSPPRGMTLWHDAIDWIGGYPHEVSTVEKVVRFFNDLGMSPQKLRPVGCRRSGCNEFVFKRND